MSRRRLALLFAVLAGFGIAGCVTLWPTARPGVTSANYDRLRHSMTLEQVSAILGSPPNDEIVAEDEWIKFNRDVSLHAWRGDRDRILLAFDEHGTVCQGAGEFRDARSAESRWQMGLHHDERFLERLRRLAGF